MKRKILILFIVIGIAAEVIFVSSKLLGASKNKNVIAEKIEEKIGARTEIKGKVQLKLFPIPKFVISHLRLYDLKYKNSSYNVRASLFEARVPILSLLTGDINIKEILIENAKIEHIKILGNSDAAKHVDLINLPYKKIKLVESALILNSNRELTTKFDNLNLELENHHNSIKISSRFSSGINNYSVESYVAKKNKADLDIDLSVNFTGGSLDLTASYDGKLKQYRGDTSISGANIQELFFNNFMSTWFLFPDNRKFSYNSSFSFAKQDGKLSIKDGEISGEAIKGEFSGLLEDKKRGVLSFNVDYLNLDALFSTHKQSYIREEMAFMNVENKYNFFNSSENVSISGLFKKVIYKDKEIGPLNIDMSLNEESNMQIDNLSFELEGGVYNNLSGVFKHNFEGYKFEGNITSKGDDIKSIAELIGDSKFVRREGVERSAYELSAELILSDSVLDLRNINAIIGLGEVKGEVHYNILEQSKSKIFLDAKALDFNDFLVRKGKNDVRHLIHLLYDKLAVRESGISLLQNFLWLRNIFNEINFELNLKETIFNDRVLDVVKIDGLVKHRIFDIKDFHIKSEYNDMNTSFLISLDDSKPLLNINIDANKADLALFNYSDGHQNKNSSWSKELILFPNFENMDFNLTSKFKHLKYHELAVKDTIFNLSVENNVLKLEEVSGKIDEGSFKIDGNFIMDGLPQLLLTYNFERFNIGNFLAFFFNIDNINALSNVAGNLQTYGNTPHIMIKQIKSKNKYYVANLTVDKLAIPKIIQDVADMSVDPKGKFNQPLSEEIRLGSTNFNSTNGELNIVNGIILINNIKLSMPGLEAATAGKIDLVNKLIKINSIIKFVAQYQSRKGIEKTALTLTHSLEGDFDKVTGKYDLFQINSFINNLKSLYMKVYNRLDKK